MTTQATIERPVAERQVPEPIRIIRERRWDKASRQYVEFIISQEQLEASRRRREFVEFFDPCGVAQ